MSTKSKYLHLEGLPEGVAKESLLALPDLIPPTITIRGCKYYPDFNSVSILGDGMPMARFTFNTDHTLVFFMFATPWKDNDKLMDPINPNYIPIQFPIEDFKTHLSKFRL
jgi:hypothetical protein